MKQTARQPFLWIPGAGCDDAASRRMRRNFPRPREPMGEAWFMGETRRAFGADETALSYADLHAMLFEIASGTRSFGPRPEWTDWFHFLLADETEFSVFGVLNDPLIEPLASAFFALYPLGVTREPYTGFARDSLETLGRAIMSATCWSDGRIKPGELLQRRKSDWGTWGWDAASGDLSASMFFCLKYLPCAEIGPWLRSVFAIEDRYWRAQLLVWFVGAHDMLTGKTLQPAQFPEAMRPDIAWENADVLTGVYYDVTTAETAEPFLPEANRRAALDAAAACFDAETCLDWLCAIAEDETLEAELAELPDQFRALYVGGA